MSRPPADPIADGPVIQASYTRALEQKLKLAGVFAALADTAARPGWAAPLVAMASYSLVFKAGPGAFIEAAQKAGVSGAVVPDLPVEEAEELSNLARDRDFKLVLLVTPTTSPARAEKVVKACSGFVYVVSVVGTTGAREALPAQLRAHLARLRAMTDLPLCVGFGVSRPEHARDLKDVTPFIRRMRLVKDTLEVAALRRAARISAAGMETLMRAVRPGMNDLEAAGITASDVPTTSSRSASATISWAST